MAKTRKRNASTSKTPATPPAGPSADDPTKTVEHRKRFAMAVTDGLLLNARTAVSWSSPKDARDRVDAIRATRKALEVAGARVKAGDLGAGESLLMAQAVALNAMFAKFADMAHHTDLVDHLERFTRLALRAQSQCARTLEVLGGLKNPTVITKQANVAMNQQVVNGAVQQVARVELPDSGQTKLLEVSGGERMDGRTAAATGTRHLALEAVAVVDRTENRRGKATGEPQR